MKMEQPYFVGVNFRDLTKNVLEMLKIHFYRSLILRVFENRKNREN